MEYTIQKLARLAGVSTRTLRYYDQFGLLKPARLNSSGYRIYGEREVDTLQQIMFYRELGFGLEVIKEMINGSGFDELNALREHREMLRQRREQLDALLANVEQTIASREGGKALPDKDKFAGFKRKLVEDNETRFGEEIREKYGDEAVAKSNQKVLNMTKPQYQEVERLASAIKDNLQAALLSGDPGGEQAQMAADLHRQWLLCFWDKYTPEAHRGLAQMYVDDERFTAYYDQEQPGTAAFLKEAVFIYTDRYLQSK
jgi:DNA-binding transcriptional MerR regulator